MRPRGRIPHRDMLEEIRTVTRVRHQKRCRLGPRCDTGRHLRGLRFLHDTLGLAHNDINPTNIMLDDRASPVIIDFDSCIPIGKEFGSRKGGTYGWVQTPEPSVSAPENDLYGLELIARYLVNGGKDGSVDVCMPCSPRHNGYGPSPPFSRSKAGVMESVSLFVAAVQLVCCIIVYQCQWFVRNVFLLDAVRHARTEKISERSVRREQCLIPNPPTAGSRHMNPCSL